ncbi:MAG: YidC/Oxa1 family membrane protein insertase [Eubacteriales bacterium]
MSGIMDILNVPLGYIIKFCYMIIPNYALALLLFAIIVKALMFPLGIKQQKNQIKQAELRPKETAIRKRYAGREDKPTQQKMQEEVMDLYKKENYNPVGGCLPLLLQFPIIIALYNVIRNPLTYINRIGGSVPGIKEKLIEIGVLDKAKNILSEIEIIQIMKENFASLVDVLPSGFKVTDIPNFNMFGGSFDLSKIPSFTVPSWLLIIPLITFVATFLSMKLTRKFTYQPPQQSGANAAMSGKIMDFTMPLFSVWITFTVPAVVGVYWIYQNVLGVVQQMILIKMYPVPVFSEDDYKSAEKEMNGSIRKEKKTPKTQSLHRIDEDETKSNGNRELSEKAGKTQSSDSVGGAIGRAPLKEDQNFVPVEKKKTSDDKPKVRSLHRIDEEDQEDKTGQSKK